MAFLRRVHKGHANDQNQPDESDLSDKEVNDRMLREERILDAATTLLLRWGYRKTTIDDVAREAGVGKGTIYLHWKDKSELFQATIWRASKIVTEDTLQRLQTDPEGGHFHRLWTHGMMAIYENPLLADLMKGKSGIFQGLLETLPPAMVEQLIGNADSYVVKLQQAGIIRSDLPVATVNFLMGALKIGIIHVSDLMNSSHIPSSEQLTESLSDLMRRWLEPENVPEDSDAGKRIMAEWLESVNTITLQQDSMKGRTI